MDKETIEAVTARLVDEGKIIEAGWMGLRLSTIAEGASEIQLSETRTAFFAGAQHLFASILTVLDPGSEPTEDDLRRMYLIDKELREFVKEFKLKYQPAEGNA